VPTQAVIFSIGPEFSSPNGIFTENNITEISPDTATIPKLLIAREYVSLNAAQVEEGNPLMHAAATSPPAAATPTASRSMP
jgi:hypothetical protein